MKFIKRLLVFSLICIILGVTTIFGFYFYVKSDLPDVATLRDVQLQTPMQVFSQDGKLIAQFGEKRRIPLKLEEMPKELIEAVIATEDSRYYEHYGFDRLVSRVPPLLYSPRAVLRKVPVPLLSNLRVTFPL